MAGANSYLSRSVDARGLFDGMPPGRKGIDALPDEVLQHILGFLEAQESVHTCVLSCRWRNLWKSAPSLRILSTKGKFLGSVEKLCNFLDSLLVLRGGAPLDTCELRFCYLRTSSNVVQFVKRLEAVVENWFHHALVCKAQVLSLYAHNSGWIDGPRTTLPIYVKLPLNSQHLTRLELGSLLVDNSFLNFSNCPSLEHLKFEKYCFGSYGFKLDDSRPHICAPNLVSLYLDSCGSKIPVLESMPSLVKAYVGIDMVPPRDSCVIGNCTCEFCDNSYSIGDDTDSNGCVLLNGLSEAKDLTLVSAPRTVCLQCHHLIIGSFCCNNEKEIMEVSDRWRDTAAISEHLKLIEVRCDVVDERICKITLFLCAFHIHLSFSNQDKDEEEGQV